MIKKIMLIGLLSCVALSGWAATPPKELSVVLDWVVNPNHGPLVVALKRGYFEDEGLKVTFYEPTDASMPAKMVAAKRYDLAVTYQTSFTYDLVHQLPLMKVATLISSPLDCIMVLKKSGITSLAQLAGKTIGYSVPSELRMLDFYLGQGQKTPQVKKVQVGWNIAQSLLSGQVDAVSGAYRNFEKHQINLQGAEVVMFYPEDSGMPMRDELILVANHQADVAALQAFNRALTRAVQFIVNHPQLAWEAFIAYNPKLLDNRLNALSWADTRIRFDHRPAAVDVARYQRYAQFLQQQHAITKLPDFSHAFLQP